jgi:phosphoribosyl-dephospho-CoA transferase
MTVEHLHGAEKSDALINAVFNSAVTAIRHRLLTKSVGIRECAPQVSPQSGNEYETDFGNTQFSS